MGRFNPKTAATGRRPHPAGRPPYPAPETTPVKRTRLRSTGKSSLSGVNISGVPLQLPLSHDAARPRHSSSIRRSRASREPFPDRRGYRLGSSTDGSPLTSKTIALPLLSQRTSLCSLVLCGLVIIPAGAFFLQKKQVTCYLMEATSRE